MRMDQFAGLPADAEKFLEENRRPPRTCLACGHVTETYIKVCGTFVGMFMDEYPLHRHPLKDGIVSGGYAETFLQAAPWSSGPIHFLGLRLSDGTEFIWTDKEIEEWL